MWTHQFASRNAKWTTWRSIAGLLLLLPSLVLVPCTAARGLEPKSSQPNIVVFLADDLNWHYPGFNGGQAETPNLDRLAKEGTRLSEFYVHAVCSPTRAAFLTGRYPFRNGMEERSHGNDIAGLLPDERTLAEALKQVGYETAIIGKWHLGNYFQRQLPLQRGFDHQYGLYGALISYYGKVRGTTYDWHRNGETVRDDGYTTDLIAREFERLMEERQTDRPFFYYVPFNAIHGTCEAPDELIEKYRRLLGSREQNSRNGKPDQTVDKLATLEAMDLAIGRMIAAMKTKGVLDNTLIVFFNDNGGVIENPPFRGHKGHTYEGGVRVPCIVHWPGHIPADKRIDGMVHAVDLYPTLLKRAGGALEQPLPLDGIDVWDVFTGAVPSPRTEVVHSLPGKDTDTGVMSIRQGPWKLVGKELYNLTRDPGEQTDVAARHPEIYERLHARIKELVSERRTPEQHDHIPDKPLLVFGQHENAHPPQWLKPYLDALPESPKAIRKAQKKTSRKKK